MFNEPTEKEVNLLPLLVHGAAETDQIKQARAAGFGTCGQITICTEGEGSFTDSNNISYRIKRGDIFFVAPEAPHKYSPVKSPWLVRYIVFSGCELGSIFSSLNLPRSGAVCNDNELFAESQKIADSIFAAYNSEKISRHITASAYLYELLALISKRVNQYSRERTASVQRLSSTVQYINDNLGNKALSSEILSANSGISHPHMCRLFKTAYHMTPREYIIHTRLEYAKYLLCSEKNMTVQTISDKCGFNSSGYFIKVFKSKTGITPIEFRIQNTYNF